MLILQHSLELKKSHMFIPEHVLPSPPPAEPRSLSTNVQGQPESQPGGAGLGFASRKRAGKKQKKIILLASEIQMEAEKKGRHSLKLCKIVAALKAVAHPGDALIYVTSDARVPALTSAGSWDIFRIHS